MGQFALGQKGLGLALMGLTTAALAVVAYQLASMVTTAMEAIGPLVEKGGTDAASLAQAAVGATRTGTWFFHVAQWVVAGCWLAGVMHGYWLGKKQDRAAVRSEPAR
jgi:hypothetical protein